MSSYEAQRTAMVESQVRPNEVTDTRVIAAMRTLPREQFVPEALRRLAYMDQDIEFPAGDGSPARFMLSPMVQARLIQLAEIKPSDHVLDVGCTTGYSTAILARLAQRVVGLEAEPELAKVARHNLSGLKGRNPEIVEGSLAQGWAASAPYDVIVLEGSVSLVPEAFFAQITEGGRVIAVLIRHSDVLMGKAKVLIKIGGAMSEISHFDAGANPLPGFAPAPTFSL